MPATITTYYTFAAASKARASQVNANFSNYRGDLLPINETTATASNLAHDLGAPDHRWLEGYVGSMDFSSSTTTAGLVLRGDSTATAGAFLFQINSVTAAKVGATGFDGAYMKTASIPDSALATPSLNTFITVASYTFVVPAGVTRMLVYGSGGGGGGGGGGGSGAGGGGGGGGNGAVPRDYPIAVIPGETLTVAIGGGGAGGAGSVGGTGTTGTAGTSSTVTGSTSGLILTIKGGLGGLGGTLAGAIGLGATPSVGGNWSYGGNGAENGSGVDGLSGDASTWAGSAVGGATGAGGGGGGGGSSLGIGGAGGSGGNGAGGNNGSGGSTQGGGGGGGGGAGASGAGGTGGAGAGGTMTLIW